MRYEIKFIFHFFSLLFFASIAAEVEGINIPSRFHIVTVCTDTKHAGFLKLQESCKKNQVDFIVLGKEAEYPGNGTKLQMMLDFLLRGDVNDHDIVMFIDAYDVIILADKQQILNKFLAMNIPFLIAAEKSCGSPEPGWNPMLYSGLFPPSPSSFRYINTGTYIGYVGYLKRWLEDLKFIRERDDQAQIIEHYVRNKHLYNLDYNCDLFLPLYGVEDNEVIYNLKAKRLELVETHSTPCILHGNGGSTDIIDFAFYSFIRDRHMVIK